MAKRAIEHEFTGDTVAYASYDATKTMIGPLIVQNTGALVTDKYIGPTSIVMARPMEASTAIPGVYPHIITISSTIDWIFLADFATAAATRRVVLYKYNKTTQVITWSGFITLTFPTTGNVTLNAVRVVRHLYTTGTVGVSGTAVTGSSTAWQTARYAVGARIGFGSTDPTAITTWYYISAIGSDTSITLSGSAGTVSPGTSFVIEELRVYTVNTNVTATNGGLFVAKGISVDDFAAGGTTIPAATTVDNIKAVYWLADASTVTNTIPCGLAMSPTYSDTSHIMYIPNADSATALRVFKYDGRVALNSLALGKSTEAFVLKTGQGAVTATVSKTNNCRLETASHGPGTGVPCIYMVSTTKVYRIAEAGIIDAATGFINDSLGEIPPGGASTFAATSGMTSIEYSSIIDRFIITTGASQRHYVTVYDTSGGSFDLAMFSDNKQIDQSLADAGLIRAPMTQSAGFSCRVEGSIGYFTRNGSTAVINQLYILPICADWNFTGVTNSVAITPSLSTTGATKFYRLYVNSEKFFGSNNLGLQAEPYRVSFRTSGIDDNSGSWSSIDETGDLSGISPVDEIQFKFEFKTIGTTCIPARIYSLSLVYEDSTTDSHYQPSVGESSTTNKQFSWRFSTAFGGTVPTLRIRLYDAVSGGLLVDDNTASPTGTWERSTDDGGNWSAYATTDKGNETTYIRYTPASLGDDIKVRALLTQN